MIELADTAAATHPRLDALVERARRRARSACPRIGLVHPCDAAALDAAMRIDRKSVV